MCTRGGEAWGGSDVVRADELHGRVPPGGHFVDCPASPPRPAPLFRAIRAQEATPPLRSAVGYRVLGQDAGRMGGAGATELADGERAGTDALQRVTP